MNADTNTGGGGGSAGSGSGSGSGSGGGQHWSLTQVNKPADSENAPWQLPSAAAAAAGPSGTGAVAGGYNQTSGAVRVGVGGGERVWRGGLVVVVVLVALFVWGGIG